MNRILLFAGGGLNFALSVFKIAMPYVFHWREAMATSITRMWSTLYAENLGISILMLFFAYMSIFKWQELLITRLGKTVMLSISVLFIYRAAVKLFIYKIGIDGAWWRVALFLVMAMAYMIPLITAVRTTVEVVKTPMAV